VGICTPFFVWRNCRPFFFVEKLQTFSEFYFEGQTIFFLRNRILQSESFHSYFGFYRAENLSSVSDHVVAQAVFGRQVGLVFLADPDRPCSQFSTVEVSCCCCTQQDVMGSDPLFFPLLSSFLFLRMRIRVLPPPPPTATTRGRRRERRLAALPPIHHRP
jgi:hypothetical protein